jgi:hypothetical protein
MVREVDPTRSLKRSRDADSFEQLEKDIREAKAGAREARHQSGRRLKHLIVSALTHVSQSNNARLRPDRALEGADMSASAFGAAFQGTVRTGLGYPRAAS